MMIGKSPFVRICAGAMPVLRDGLVVGAVGVSGAKSEDDEQIAKAASMPCDEDGSR